MEWQDYNFADTLASYYNEQKQGELFLEASQIGLKLGSKNALVNLGYYYHAYQEQADLALPYYIQSATEDQNWQACWNLRAYYLETEPNPELALKYAVLALLKKQTFMMEVYLSVHRGETLTEEQLLSLTRIDQSQLGPWKDLRTNYLVQLIEQVRGDPTLYFHKTICPKDVVELVFGYLH